MAWQSLHLCYSKSSDVLIQVIDSTLNQQGYTRYNPFDAIPGLAYSDSIRLFLDPSAERVIGNYTPSIAAALSQLGVVLDLTLEGEQAAFTVYHAGEAVPPLPTLQPYIKEGFTSAQLEGALSGSFTSDPKNDNIVPMDILPDDVQNMAKKLNPKHINRLFNKIMKQVGIGGDEARATLNEHQQVNWATAGGKQLHAIMRCLDVSPIWYKPDFVSVRDAYQLHLRRQQNPKANLYPGDEEAMQAVPNALDYTPIYGGKS